MPEHTLFTTNYFCYIFWYLWLYAALYSHNGLKWIWNGLLLIYLFIFTKNLQRSSETIASPAWMVTMSLGTLVSQLNLTSSLLQLNFPAKCTNNATPNLTQQPNLNQPSRRTLIHFSYTRSRLRFNSLVTLSLRTRKQPINTIIESESLSIQRGLVTLSQRPWNNPWKLQYKRSQLFQYNVIRQWTFWEHKPQSSAILALHSPAPGRQRNNGMDRNLHGHTQETKHWGGENEIEQK